MIVPIDAPIEMQLIRNMKKSKSEVNYSKGMPKSHCGICKYFIVSKFECEKVKGIITPAMWCELFKKR